MCLRGDTRLNKSWAGGTSLQCGFAETCLSTFNADEGLNHFNRQTGGYVALKIIKSAQHYTDAARDEITLLKQIADGDVNNDRCVVHLVDWFEHRGPNGKRLLLF